MRSRLFAAAALLALALASPPASAASNQDMCQSVIAGENGSRDERHMAALLYFHGMWMGERCRNFEIDYVKSLTMLRELGEIPTYRSLVKRLQQRAAIGNNRAKRALRELGEPEG